MTHPPLIRHLVLVWLALAALQVQAQLRQRNLEPVAVQLPGGQRQQLYDASYALVIGASNYRNGWNRLPGVVDDVKAVAAVLEKQGFEVTTLMDPTRDQLDQTLRNFVAQRGLREGNRLLVYFAGHGHTLTAGGRKLGYIVPVDAPNPSRDPAGFRALAYSMESIEVHARQIEARHALFVFDSCFSGTIFRTRSGVPDAISDRTSKPVRQFITAGDEDQTVPDKSIFRRQIERGLGEGDADLNGDGYITGTELGEYLQDQVTNYSRRAQTPRHGKIRDPDLDRGDFVFLSPRTSAATPVAARRQPGEVFRDCADCPELVVIGSGSFTMGSPKHEVGRAGNGSEGPAHPVTISRPFALGRYEVTVGEFKRFVAASSYVTEAERNVRSKGCHTFDDADGKWDWREGRNWRNLGFEQSDRHPVVCVSWNDAQAYVQWLGRQTGQTYRLPSEAEWEYAARAGSTGSRPWGDDPNEACRHANGVDLSRSPTGNTWGSPRHECNDSFWFTAPVGSYATNRFGLNDMIGNAWEWVQDVWHETYDGAPSDGSVWTVGGDPARRMLRGGSWDGSPQVLRSAHRSRNTPDIRSNFIGFRIARTL